MNTQISIVEEPRPWIRLYTEFATDPIIQSLAFEDQRHFVMVLLMKGSAILDRRLEPEVRDRIIRKTLGLDIETAEAAKTRLMSMNLINESWQPLSWDKRQFEGDYSKKRMRKHRETSQDRHMAVTVTPPDTDTDTDTDLKESASRSSIGKPILAAAAAAPPAQASPKDKTSPCPYEEIRQLWAKNFPYLAQPYEPEKWSDQRKRLVRERWKEQPDLEWWDSFLEYLTKSDFLMGRKNGRDFQITFDWLMKTANFVKCQEGNYHG